MKLLDMVLNIFVNFLFNVKILLILYKIGIESMTNYPESLMLTFVACMGFFARRVRISKT